MQKLKITDYNGSLENHYVKQVYFCAYQVSKSHKGITANLIRKKIKLSKQQKYILTLLSQGYNNAEIVNITGLTINTVKAHTKQAYLRLDVHRAADAILAAKVRPH